MTTTDRERRLFRAACGRFATGVTAVTGAAVTGDLAALTVNSFASVSLDPMRVLICVAHRSPSFAILTASPRIAVHVLSDEQEEIARRLATTGLSGAERLAQLPWTPGPAGEPLLKGAAARLAGPIVQCVDSGDHTIVVIEVDDIHLEAPGSAALVFIAGRLTTVPATS
jgi:flavin reductase (DIM6/NTAB) family NADH-FMN oxidoreductase RutF